MAAYQPSLTDPVSARRARGHFSDGFSDGFSTGGKCVAQPPPDVVWYAL